MSDDRDFKDKWPQIDRTLSQLKRLSELEDMNKLEEHLKAFPLLPDNDINPLDENQAGIWNRALSTKEIETYHWYITLLNIRKLNRKEVE